MKFLVKSIKERFFFVKIDIYYRNMPCFLCKKEKYPIQHHPVTNGSFIKIFHRRRLNKNPERKEVILFHDEIIDVTVSYRLL